MAAGDHLVTFLVDKDKVKKACFKIFKVEMFIKKHS